MEGVEDGDPGTRGNVLGMGEEAWFRGQSEWFSWRIKAPRSL